MLCPGLFHHDQLYFDLRDLTFKCVGIYVFDIHFVNAGLTYLTL